MSSFWVLQQVGILFFLGVVLLVALSNWRAMRRLGRTPYAAPCRWPRVSVLVPARNEEENIGPCVRSLLAQEYPDFQVLVLDDESSDGTAEALASVPDEVGRLVVMQGAPLPAGWLGKHWACQQLSEAADGELLLFTDADTRHHPRALRDAVGVLLAEEADLLSALPHQEVGSWAERLLVPMIPWALFSFLPLTLAHRWRWLVLSAAIGQYMLFRGTAYDQIGGHAAVRQHAADDLALGRRVKTCGLRLRLVDGGERISCRMYHNAREVYEGLSKNLLAAFGYLVPAFLFVWLWLGFVFWQPLVTLGRAGLGVDLSLQSILLAAAAVAASLLLWGLTYWRFGFRLWLVPLYPVTVLSAVWLALRSLLLTVRGRATWKGRTLASGTTRIGE
ncbi:MAG TPA: glycosyltransferase family 2 protein [Anaerolineae bacterium]|nr:glycosyltransferase family 2 protein [Anaerolineae bacterium]